MEEYYKRQRQIAEDRLDMVLSVCYRHLNDEVKKEIELKLKAIK